MEKNKFKVKIYYSGFCTYEVEAENQEEAILKSRQIYIKQNEILSNLENWEEADTATELKK